MFHTADYIRRLYRAIRRASPLEGDPKGETSFQPVLAPLVTQGRGSIVVLRLERKKVIQHSPEFHRRLANRFAFRRHDQSFSYPDPKR